MKNMRNPLFITAIVIISLALTTLIFYPALIPAFIFSETMKLALYVMTQSTIIGLCLRTLGRLNNQELIDAWTNKQLVPVRIGSEIIRVKKRLNFLNSGHFESSFEKLFIILESHFSLPLKLIFLLVSDL